MFSKSSLIGSVIRAGWLATMGLLWAGCTGNDSSGAGTKVPVSVMPLFGTTVPPCVAGYEHPNICCKGAPYKATVCTEDIARPFDNCETGQFAYPDATACCSLDDKTACTPPSNTDSTPDGGPQAGCENPCLPGAYPCGEVPISPSGASTTGYLCCFGTGLSVSPPKPSCSLCTQQPEWCSASCPTGWSAPAGGRVDLCCQTDSKGRSACFSQAEGIGSGKGGSAFASPSSCVGEEFLDDGNSYVMKCHSVDLSTPPECTCLVNGAVTKTVHDGRCTDLTTCDFPQ